MAVKNSKFQPAQISSFMKNAGRLKMQEIGEFTWDRAPNLATQFELYNHTHYYQFQEVKVNYNIQDLNSSIFKRASVDHKEIAEKTKDHTLNIRSYYRDRWLQEHKEKRKDNITKQAVKISPNGSAFMNESWQVPHEASLYRKLVSKQFFDEDFKKDHVTSDKSDILSEPKIVHSNPGQLNKNMCDNVDKQNLEFSKLNSKNHYYQWIKSVSAQSKLSSFTQTNCTNPTKGQEISDTLGSKSISNPEHDTTITTSPKDMTLNTQELGEDDMNTTSVQVELENEDSMDKNVIHIN